MKQIPFIAVLVSLALTSCGDLKGGSSVQSSNVEATEVYQAYNVVYDEKDESLLVEAQFRHKAADGVPIELVTPSEIQVNGESLTLVAGSNFKYAKKLMRNRIGPKADDAFTLTWFDKSRNQVKSSFNVLSVEAKNVPTAFKNSDAFFTYEIEDQLRTGETVTGAVKVDFENALENEVLSNSTDLDQSKVKFNASTLSAFGAGGNLELIFKRVLTQSVKGAPIDGRLNDFGQMTVEFRTEKKSFAFLD
jgi:hypothetical protein